MNPVHDKGSMDPVHMKVVHMDPVQSGGPWTSGPCFVLIPIILVIITFNLFRVNRRKRTRGRQVSSLIKREVVTSRCHGSKMSRSQQTEVLQIWHKNDIYTVFPVHDCTQRQNGSPHFFSIVWKCKLAISIKIQKFFYHGNLTSHFSSLLKRAALLIIM